MTGGKWKERVFQRILSHAALVEMSGMGSGTGGATDAEKWREITKRGGRNPTREEKGKQGRNKEKEPNHKPSR